MQREFGHWDERVAVLEGRQAPELFASFKDLPFDEQLSLVTDDETFQAWGFCQLLLKESLEAAFDDPIRAVNFAELAVKVSQNLGDAYDPHWVLDLRARAHAYLGNAQRVLGELRSAEAAFREAESLMARSMTGNPLIEAEILHLKASLLCAQRRSEKALGLVDRALGIYRKADEPQGIGVVLLKKGKILEEAGNLDEAIRLVQEVFEKIDPETEPRLALVARYNLLTYLSLAGRYQEADEMLQKARGFFLGHARPLDLLRLQWAEGKIAIGLDRPREAEADFRRVQEEFLARGMGYDAALVSLDLAILYAREHRTEDLKRLAAEILQVFESRDVHREAVAALILFRSACEEERLTVELAGQIATLLQRERRSK